jgi:glycosyltransferase involved in cell wall biosynthesis
MELAYNCVELPSGYRGGVASFTHGLLKGLLQSGAGNTLHVIVTEENAADFASYQQAPNVRLKVIGRASNALKTAKRVSMLLGSKAAFRTFSNGMWRDARDYINRETQVAYVPTTTLPYYDSRIPTLLSMHDIQQVHFPQYFTWTEKVARKYRFGESAKEPICFQASSHFIRNDLISNFSSVSLDRVFLIPEGVDYNLFRSAGSYKNHVLPENVPDSFLFMPAQLWHHKNHLLVLRALKIIFCEQGIKLPLVMTGKPYATYPLIMDFIAKEKMDWVKYLGAVDFSVLLALYAHSRLLICASQHESSSLPVLEAAAVGTPIVASNIPPHVEMAQNIRMNLFDVQSAEHLAEILLENWERNHKLDIEANIRASESYDWSRIGQRYWDLFEHMLRT